jgi:hypothetical protein
MEILGVGRQRKKSPNSPQDIAGRQESAPWLNARSFTGVFGATLRYFFGCCQKISWAAQN